MIKENLESIGSFTIHFVESVGRLIIFLVAGIVNIFLLPFQFNKILEHVWFIGAKSMLVIILTGLFTGMVLGLQGYYTLSKFGSEGMLGSVVALSLIRELGPVLAGFMITARAGSAIAAEIGVMRISEQIDALETMDINPIKFLFSPRIVAALLSFPLLTAIFDSVGIFGGYLSGALMTNANKGIYAQKVVQSVVMEDVTGGFIKSFVFALIVTTICCFQGYFTHLNNRGAHGARGVSLSTTNAVVTSCVLILVFDYIITYLLM
ncbi:MAG: ABC transporter permease [Desulfobacteraceae bacterium]|nr:ABC transporter permease [Desulfobacteraceae bacterium]